MKTRKLKGISLYFTTALSSLITILIFYTAFYGAFPSKIQRAGFLMFMIPLIIFLVPATKKSKTDSIPLTDIVLGIIVAISFAWILIDYDRIAFRIRYVHAVTNFDLIFGTIAVLSVIEATRRTLGWILVIITSVFIGYLFIGPYIPGPISFPALKYSLFIEHMYLVPEALFGIITGITSTFLYTFIAFGTFLLISGVDKYYMDICLALTGKARGGPAKVAVISSALMGTLSGSTISNVAVTGNLTIPMMKDIGFTPRDAASIETAASTGGSLTPPVMGAGVFLMSAITGIPLIVIITYSIIPAIMYFLSIFIYVELKARYHNLEGSPPEKLPILKEVLGKSFYLFIPIIVLIGFLLKGYTPFIASAACTVLIVLFSFGQKATRIDIPKFILALKKSCENMMSITAVSACAGIIMGILTLSGLINKITSILLQVSGGVPFIALLCLAFLSYILGMGMPITLSYLLISMLGAPALLKLGIPILASHLFIFWFANVATISPPVCMTAFVAAEIAQEKNYMGVGFTTLNVAKAIYLVPFFFIYTIILSSNIWGPIQVFIQYIPLIIALNIFTAGYFVKILKIWERGLIAISVIALGIAIFSQNIVSILLSTSIGIIILWGIYYNQKKELKS